MNKKLLIFDMPDVSICEAHTAIYEIYSNEKCPIKQCVHHAIKIINKVSKFGKCICFVGNENKCKQYKKLLNDKYLIDSKII